MFTFSASWIAMFSVNAIQIEFYPFYCGREVMSLQAYTVQAECLSTWLPGEQKLGDSCGHGKEDGDGCDGSHGSNGDDGHGILVVMVVIKMVVMVMVMVVMKMVVIVMVTMAVVSW